MDTSTSHHAILIGVDAYPEQPLKGCVNDVWEIKTLLEGNQSLANIQILTAPSAEGSGRVNESKDSLPVRENVVNAFENTIKAAKPGDSVYFHFSGHGSTIQPSKGDSNSLSNKFAGELALVLPEGRDPEEVDYLPTRRLAGFLNRMIRGGLILTIVLDCCFSAAAYRDDTVRYFRPKTPSRSLTAGQNDWISYDGFTKYRGVATPWILDPKKYSLIVGAAPHEEAVEIRVRESGMHFGKLSYILRSVLLDHSEGLQIKQRDLYRNIRARIFAEFHGKGSQTPCLFGNKELHFLGQPTETTLRRDEEEAVKLAAVKDKDGRFILLAGEGHGMRPGDGVVVHTLKHNDTAKRSESQGNGEVILRVSRTHAVTSVLEFVDSTHAQMDMFKSRFAGFPVVLKSRLLLHDFPVVLDLDTLSDLETWRGALSAYSLLVIGKDVEADRQIQVRLTSDQAGGPRRFQLLDASGHEYPNVPSMPEDYTDMIAVVSVISHIARYSCLKTLSNITLSDNDPWRKSFTVFATKPDSVEIHEPGRVIDLQEETDPTMSTVDINIQNDGDDDLYVYIYNLGPQWEVDHVHNATGEVVFAEKRRLPDQIRKGFQRTFKRGLRTTVPDALRTGGAAQSEDIIKVFITSHWTSFDIFEQCTVWLSTNRKPPLRSKAPGNSVAERWAVFDFPLRTRA